MFSDVNVPPALVLLLAVRPLRVASEDWLCWPSVRVTVTVSSADQLTPELLHSAVSSSW